MAGIIPNEGEKILLEAMVGKTAAGNLKLKLFTNNYTPAHDDVIADYTEMGAVQGYTEKTLTPAGWNAGVEGTGIGTSSANKAYIEYPQQTFTADGTGGAQTVYGYVIMNDAETKVIAAERFSSPQTYATSGDSIKITPKLTLGTE
jgi:hypothetical protein